MSGQDVGDKQPASSNLQGLENIETIPRGTPSETIDFHANQQLFSNEHQPTGKTVREGSDILRLQDEDFRARINDISTGRTHVNNDDQSQVSVAEYDPVVHPDDKHGRVYLSIRFNQESSQLIVQILDAQGLIRPEQAYAPEMSMNFSLIGNGQKEKHSRVFVENAAVLWKEPMVFSDTHDKLLGQTLHILATNDTDPSAPRDREAFIRLRNLSRNGDEIKQWYNLKFVASS
ncbi:unnamed protein product [Adineta ricciae]|uniref:Uncharacterized protein n=1 Tax=Adineta ricciae TaxID=249248 RepID=A0A816EYA0_ADIRI|nr:unnamed protein product [Adineta ricciae]